MAVSFDDIPESAYSEIINRLFGGQALKESSTCFNFVCPSCGDLNFPNKKKAYIYKDKWLYRCYKCGDGDGSFMNYLKQNSPDDYRRLLFHAFDGEQKVRQPVKQSTPIPTGLPFMDGELIPITDNHPLAKAGLDICRQRKIRPEVYEYWFVCQEGNQFLQRDPSGNLIINPNTGRPVGNEYKNRIIIPFYRYGGKWEQFDARAIDRNNPLRYMNYAGKKRTAYNIDFVNFRKPFYILEGTIDSTFVKNSIAIGGVQHLQAVLTDNPEIMRNIGNCTIIWDNDDAGRKAMFDSTKQGFKWFEWEGISEKDVNGAVMDGTLPISKGGFVDPDAIVSRTRNPAAANVLFMLRYGNVKKEDFRQKQQARKAAAEAIARTRQMDVMF